MSNFIYGLFENMKVKAVKNKDCVFPGTGKGGHLVESVKQIQFITAQTQYALNEVSSKAELEKKVADDAEYQVVSGIKFCLHDL